MTADETIAQFDLLFFGKLELCPTCRSLDCRCDEDTMELMERERGE